MRRLRPRLPVIAILLGAAVPAALLLAAAGRHMVTFIPMVHILVVGLAGALAAAAAIAMSVIAARRNDSGAVWLGMAFSAMTTILTIHALATPGVLVGNNGLVQIAGVMNLPVGAWILALASLPVLRRPRRARLLLEIQLLLVTILAAAGAIALTLASQIPMLTPPALETDLVLAAGGVPLVLVGWRAARTYLLTRRTSDLIVAGGLVWMIGALYGLLYFTMMQAGWWGAHVLEVSGIGMVAIPAALDLRHAVGSRPLVGDLRATHLVEHEEAFLGGRVRALLVRLGRKDPSTEGHTRRVAALAVALGEQLGLPEGRLRQLALGGLLHDIGKLSVPNVILQKPGRLTDEEFAAIRRHPGDGRQLLTELGGFTPLVLDLVESHHERLDSAGYPNRSEAGRLALEVRILTVADVYDALTADRVYREAWPAQRALALLHEESGSAFDPVCVDALHRMMRSAPPEAEREPAAA
ncbi:MAG: HD-GYP domain-containing protein [Solirubrobacteraceae bacterium]